MRDAAEKVHRGFGIAVLELPVSRTHAAHGLELAVDALGRPGDLPLADTPEEPFPGHGECEYCEGGVGYEEMIRAVARVKEITGGVTLPTTRRALPMLQEPAAAGCSSGGCQSCAVHV